MHLLKLARAGHHRLVGRLALITLLAFLPARFAHAMKVIQVKGDRALINIESGDNPSLGDQYFVMTNGKKLGLVSIAQIKGKRAIAMKKKGRVDVGSELSLARASGSSGGGSSSRSRRSSGRLSTFGGNLYVGALIGLNETSQSVNDSVNNRTITLSGMGYNLKAFADMTITGGLGLIGRFGLEKLNLASNGYTTDITYVTGDLLLRYHIIDGTFVPFVGLGLGIHFPMSKSSNALNQIPTMTVFFANVGAHYRLSSSMYITALVEYGLFPPSSDVTTTFIAVRGGAGFRF